MINIVFLGDIVAKPGRLAVKNSLQRLRNQYGIHLAVANGENASGGLGIEAHTADELFALGLEVITSGNHIWQKKDIFSYLNTNKHRIMRPYNFPQGAPGVGYVICEANGVKIGVANLIGRVFMPQLVDCPFAAIDKLLGSDLADCSVKIVDFHAEATSEKVAMGFYLDGRVSLVLGTHTHVQTADERILPKGTAYISDVGMCGPRNSVIGVQPELVIERFKSGLPGRYDVPGGPVMINGIVVSIDESSGKATRIDRINEIIS